MSGVQHAAVGMKQATLGSGSGALTETRAYNNRAWLQSVSVANTNGTPYSLGLTYYGNGNVYTASDSQNGNWTYGYDNVNRLYTATASGHNFQYTDDPWGNMTCVDNGNLHSPCTPQGLAFNNNPQNNRITTAGYSYDLAGNLVTDNTHGYIYDAENRLACVWGTDGTCTSASAMLYLYDAARAAGGEAASQHAGRLCLRPAGKHQFGARRQPATCCAPNFTRPTAATWPR